MASNVTTLHRGYPDPLADNATKMTDDYGLNYAKFIEQQWLYNEDDASSTSYGNREGFYKRRARLLELRSYKDNNVDTTPWRDLFNVSQDQAHQAFDWTYFNIIPKFIDIIRDKFPLEIFEINAEGLDKQTLTAKEKYRKNLEDQMYSAPFVRKFSQEAGLDIAVNNKAPESQEEIDVLMSEYKEGQEIATEVCLRKIYDTNHWEPIYQLLIEDLVVYGFGVKSIKYSPNKVIEYERVNPLNFIYSRDYKYTKDKRGCYYFGQVEVMRVEEIEKRAGRKFTEKELKAIVRGRSYSGVIGDPANYSNSEIYDFNVEVLRFSFKTTFKEVYKQKYENGPLTKKPSDWDLVPESKSKKLEGSFDVWMEGEYIVGTEMVYNYSVREDMVRSNKNLNEVLPPFIIYSLDEPSMVERLRLINDDVHSTRLKLNHLIYTMKPDGIAVDVDGLTEVDLASGGILDPQGVLDYLGQRGDLIYSGTNLEGNRQGPPVTPLINGDANKLNVLIQKYNQDLREMYDVTGINPVADGTAPTKGALVGVNQQALSAANVATKHILLGALSIMQRSCEATVSRIQNLSMLGENYEDAMRSMVGEKIYSIMKKSAPLHLFEMGINISIAPDQEEKQAFRMSLDEAVKADRIDFDDRLELMDIKNLKLARKALRLKIEKRKKQKHLEQMQLQQAQAQAQSQAAINIEKARQQSLSMEIQASQAKTGAEAQKEAMIKQYERETDLILLQEKYKYELMLKQMEVDANKNLNKFKEDRKDDRTYEQANQQSKMISQRDSNTGPVDFKTEKEINKIVRDTREPQIPTQQPV